MSAQIKKVLVNADALQVQDSGENPGDGFFGRSCGATYWSSRSVLVRSGAGSALRLIFPLGLRGNALEQNKVARDHVIGQVFLQKFA